VGLYLGAKILIGGVIMNRPFFRSGIIGLLVIVMSVVLMTVFPNKAPSMMEGFFTPIIAFEFVQTPQEVFQLFGSTDSVDRQKLIAEMDLGNRLDYIYMCLYALFLLLFSLNVVKVTGKKGYYAGPVLALVVLARDDLQNVQLLGITSKLASQDFENELCRLHYFTWLKWGGIAAIFLVLFPYFIRGRAYSKIIAIMAVVSLVLAVLSFIHRSVLNEIFAFSVAMMFILMIIYCFAHKDKKGQAGVSG
jgi:hypothetical protein